MRIAVWQYEDPEKQAVHFRGYVKTYNENVVTRHACPKVRPNKWQATKNKKRLLRKLRKQKA